MTCWHMMDIVIDFSSQVLRLFELTCLLHFSPFFLDYLELFLLRPGSVPGLQSIHFFSAHLLRSDIHSPYWSALDFWKSLCLKMQVFKLDFFCLVRTWMLLPAKIHCKLDKKSSSSNSIFQTRNFKIQVQIDRGIEMRMILKCFGYSVIFRFKQARCHHSNSAK